MQVAPHQPDQPVAQIIPVQQDQHHEQQHDAGHQHRFADPVQPGRELGQGLELHRLDLNPLHARRRDPAARADDFLFNRVIGLARAIPDAGSTDVFAQLAQLGADGVLVGRQIGADLAHLVAQIGTHAAQHAQRDGHHHQRRRHARQAPALESAHGRIEQEAQQQRQRQRHQQIAAEVEAEYHQRRNRQTHQHAQRRQHGRELGKHRRFHARRLLRRNTPLAWLRGFGIWRRPRCGCRCGLREILGHGLKSG